MNMRAFIMRVYGWVFMISCGVAILCAGATASLITLNNSGWTPMLVHSAPAIRSQPNGPRVLAAQANTPKAAAVSQPVYATNKLKQAVAIQHKPKNGYRMYTAKSGDTFARLIDPGQRAHVCDINKQIREINADCSSLRVGEPVLLPIAVVEKLQQTRLS